MTLAERLLAATPLPPLDATPDELHDALARMIVERDAILATATPEPGDALVRAELFERDRAWGTALTNARDEIGSSRIAAGRARRYK